MEGGATEQGRSSSSGCAGSDMVQEEKLRLRARVSHKALQGRPWESKSGLGVRAESSFPTLPELPASGGQLGSAEHSVPPTRARALKVP